MRIVWSMEFAQWGMRMLLLCSCQPSLCFVFVDAYWLVVVCCFHFFCVFVVIQTLCGWLGNRVVSVLDSDAEGPGFKSQSRCCWVTVLGKLFTPIVPLFTKQQLIAAHLRVAGVTAGLAESNGSLLPGLWLTSPAGWLPRTGISSGTLCSVIEYGLPFLNSLLFSQSINRWFIFCAV